MEKPEYDQKYYQEHREEELAASKKWYREHKEQRLASNKKYRQEHKERCELRARERNKRIRLDVLSKVGKGKLECVRCGCNDIRFLEINHINGGGGKEQKATHRCIAYLVRDGRSVVDLELLCKPCNIIHALELKHKQPIPLIVHHQNNDWEKEL